MPEIKQQRWKIVEYSKRQINDAGTIIRKDNTTAEELAFATQVIDNWRAAHAYPMHVIYIHLRRMAAPRNDILVVERLKRLDSIIGKLRRETRMDLWRMQDLSLPLLMKCFTLQKNTKNPVFDMNINVHMITFIIQNHQAIALFTLYTSTIAKKRMLTTKIC